MWAVHVIWLWFKFVKPLNMLQIQKSFIPFSVNIIANIFLYCHNLAFWLQYQNRHSFTIFIIQSHNYRLRWFWRLRAAKTIYLHEFVFQFVNWQTLSLFQNRLLLFLSKRRLRAAENVPFPFRHVHGQHVPTGISRQHSSIICQSNSTTWAMLKNNSNQQISAKINK